MARKWIDDLKVASEDAAQQNRRRNEELQLVEAAFDRIRAELSEVVDALNEQFPQLHLNSRPSDGGVILDASSHGKKKSLQLFMDANARQIRSQPEGVVSLAEDRAELSFDLERLSFVDRNHEVSDEEVVKRLLDRFIRSIVAAKS